MAKAKKKKLIRDRKSRLDPYGELSDRAAFDKLVEWFEEQIQVCEEKESNEDEDLGILA